MSATIAVIAIVFCILRIVNLLNFLWSINDIFLEKVYHLLCVCFVECYFIAVA